MMLHEAICLFVRQFVWCLTAHEHRKALVPGTDEQRSVKFKIILNDEVRIREFWKCVKGVHTNGEKVKTIDVEQSYSTIRINFFHKINNAMWGD
jgi:phage-related protein